MSADTGVVRGEGKMLCLGRQMAIGEGRLLDAKGRLLAHGTTTCHIVRDGIS
jgi:acyl-coenzyme A thioesterase PaaI-like protein